MIRIHLTAKDDLHALTKKLLADELGHGVDILQTSAGKPYVEGNKLYFSLSHSGKRGVVVLHEQPVGVDLEYIKDRTYHAILSRFTARERQEITSQEQFFKHWTAKEAFIKMNGYTLSSALKYTEFFEGRIYFNGEKQPAEITHYKLGKTGILAICR